nr:hypothetical protein GCM10020093_060950 [Planobispora longispora]
MTFPEPPGSPRGQEQPPPPFAPPAGPPPPAGPQGPTGTAVHPIPGAGPGEKKRGLFRRKGE